jgi:sugar lactone lactonase YvrE
MAGSRGMLVGTETSPGKATMRSLLLSFILLAVVAVLYLLLWPVPITPQAWQAPPDRGYVGPHALNSRLAAAEHLDIAGARGPEAVAVAADGRVYAATEDGWIVRLGADGGGAERWADTGGRPLGMTFTADGTLMVADAMHGLLAVSPAGEVRLLAEQAGGVAIGFADDLDIAPNGRVYLSDASTRFSWRQYGPESARLALLENGLDGRLIEYDPASGEATVLLDGLAFANGVAVGHVPDYLLLTETARYRVLRVWIAGPRRGEHEVLLDNLPGFPDNITRGADGRYWLALFSPRVPLLDRLAPRPFLRKLVARIPAALQPQPQAHGHVIAINSEGRILADLQDAEGGYAMTTSALEAGRWLYVGSLTAPTLARLPWEAALTP